MTNSTEDVPTAATEVAERAPDGTAPAEEPQRSLDELLTEEWNVAMVMTMVAVEVAPAVSVMV